MQRHQGHQSILLTAQRTLHNSTGGSCFQAHPTQVRGARGGSCFPNVTAFSDGGRQREFPRGTTQLSCRFCSGRMGRGLLAVGAVRFLCMLQLPTTRRRIINACVNQQTRQQRDRLPCHLPGPAKILPRASINNRIDFYWKRQNKYREPVLETCPPPQPLSSHCLLGLTVTIPIVCCLYLLQLLLQLLFCSQDLLRLLVL